MLTLLMITIFSAQDLNDIPMPPAGASELNQVANIVRAFRPKDQFEAPLQPPSFDGRELILELRPLSLTEACSGSPSWEYSAQNQTLYVSNGWHSITLSTFYSRQGTVTKRKTPSIWPEEGVYLSFGCVRHTLTPYTGTNAYGAKFRIEPTSQDINALADTLPKGVKWPDTFRLEMPGSAAKALVPHLKIRITGTVADWKRDLTVACSSYRREPTSSSPYDRRENICLYNGRVSKMELIDGRSGEVLDTITRPDGED